MVGIGAGNLQIARRKALQFETKPQRQRQRRFIIRQDIGFETVQTKHLEGDLTDCLSGFSRQPPVLIVLIQVIAQNRRLEGAGDN
jgi:hypothetical protein